MNQEQLNRMHTAKGFIAALDQSGGSTPKALKAYGIPEDRYHSEEEMFDLVHQMRTRIITSPAFTSEHILAAILFEMTMDRTIDGLLTAVGKKRHPSDSESGQRSGAVRKWRAADEADVRPGCLAETSC